MADLEACNEVADSMYAQKERYKSISADKSKAQAISDSLAANYKTQATAKTVLADSYEKEAGKNKTIGKIWKGTAICGVIVAAIEFIYIGLERLISPK